MEPHVDGFSDLEVDSGSAVVEAQESETAAEPVTPKEEVELQQDAVAEAENVEDVDRSWIYPPRKDAEDRHLEFQLMSILIEACLR